MLCHYANSLTPIQPSLSDSAREETVLVGRTAAHPPATVRCSNRSSVHIINGVAYARDGFDIDNLISFLVASRAYGCLQDASQTAQ